MTKITRRIALPIVSAGIIGAGALGMAGLANATATGPTGPGYLYSPGTYATPAPVWLPGWHHRHGPTIPVPNIG